MVAGFDAFPTQNDIHTTLGDGVTAHEKNLVYWAKGLRPYGSFFGKNGVIAGPGFVIGGLAYTGGAGLNADFDPGAVWIDGHRIEVTGTPSILLIDNQTQHVYLQVSKTGTGPATAVSFIGVVASSVDDFSSPPDNAILLATFVTAAGTVQNAYDWRRFSSCVAPGTYEGDGAPSRVIELAFVPSSVVVVERGTLRSWRYSPRWLPPLTSGAHKGLVCIEHTLDQEPHWALSSSISDVPVPTGGAQDGFLVGDSATQYECTRHGHLATQTFLAQPVVIGINVVTQNFPAPGVLAADIAIAAIQPPIAPGQYLGCYCDVPVVGGTINVNLVFNALAAGNVGPYQVDIAWRRRVLAQRSTNQAGVLYDFVATP